MWSAALAYTSSDALKRSKRSAARTLIPPVAALFTERSTPRVLVHLRTSLCESPREGGPANHPRNVYPVVHRDSWKAGPFKLCTYLTTAREPAKYSRLLLHRLDSVNAREVRQGAPSTADRSPEQRGARPR